MGGRQLARWASCRHESCGGTSVCTRLATDAPTGDGPLHSSTPHVTARAAGGESTRDSAPNPSQRSGGCVPGVHTGSSSRPSTPPRHPTGSISTSVTHKSLRRRWAVLSRLLLSFCLLLLRCFRWCVSGASARPETKANVLNSNTGLVGARVSAGKDSRSRVIRRETKRATSRRTRPRTPRRSTE